MVEAARAIQCIAHVYYHSLHHFHACQTLPAAVNGGNAKTEEHHALDFPRISLAYVGSGSHLSRRIFVKGKAILDQHHLPCRRLCMFSCKLFINAFSDSLNDESPTWDQNTAVNCVSCLLSYCS